MDCRRIFLARHGAYVTIGASSATYALPNDEVEFYPLRNIEKVNRLKVNKGRLSIFTGSTLPAVNITTENGGKTIVFDSDQECDLFYACLLERLSR